MIGPALAIGILIIIGLTVIPHIVRSRREDKELDRISACGPGCICGGENVRQYQNAQQYQQRAIAAYQQAGQRQEYLAQQFAASQQPIIVHQPHYQPQPEPAPIIIMQAPAPQQQRQRQVIVVQAPQQIAQPQAPQIHYLQPPQPQYQPDHLAAMREAYRREVEAQGNYAPQENYGYYTENGQPVVEYQPEALPQRRALPPPSQQPQATTAARQAWARRGK